MPTFYTIQLRASSSARNVPHKSDKSNNCRLHLLSSAMGKRKGLEALGEARLATIVAFGDVRSEHTLKGAIPQSDALAALRQYGRIESYVHPASDSVMQRFGLIQDGAPQPVLLAVFFSIKAGSTFHSLAIDATLWPSHSSQASHQRSPSGCPAHHARLVSLPNLNHLQYSVTAALPTPTHPLSAYPPIFPNRSWYRFTLFPRNVHRSCNVISSHSQLHV